MTDKKPKNYPERIIKRYPENVFSILFSFLALIFLVNIIVLTPFSRLDLLVRNLLSQLPEAIKNLSLIMSSTYIIVVLVSLLCLYFTFKRRYRLILKIVVSVLSSYGFALLLCAFMKIFQPTIDSIKVSKADITLTFVSSIAASITTLYIILNPHFRGMKGKIILFAFNALLLLRFSSVTEPTSSILLGVISGWFIGSVCHLLFGIESRNKTPNQILQALQRLGYNSEWLKKINADARGSEPFIVHNSDGSKLFVKVVSKEHLDADSLFKIWRKILLKSTKTEIPYLSVQQKIEHEAFISMLARKAGLLTPDVFGTANDVEGNGYLIYEYIDGAGLDNMDGRQINENLIGKIFEQIKLMHKAKIAHRDLRLANIFIKKNGDPMIMDFGFGESFADKELLSRDLVEIFVSLSLLTSVDLIARKASEVLDKNLISVSLKYLQPAALSSSTRNLLKEKPELLLELREKLLKYAQVSDKEVITITRLNKKRFIQILILGLLIIPLSVWSKYVGVMVLSHKILSSISIILLLTIYFIWYLFSSSLEFPSLSIITRFIIVFKKLIHIS